MLCDFLVGLLRVAFEIESVRAGLRLEMGGAGDGIFAFVLDDCFLRAQLVPAFARGNVAGIESNGGAEIGARLRHAPRDGVALGAVYVILNEAAARNGPPQRVFLVVRRTADRFGKGFEGSPPVTRLFAFAAAQIRLLRAFEIDRRLRVSVACAECRARLRGFLRGERSSGRERKASRE